MKDKKEMIREFLKSNKMASTGKIAEMIRSNQIRCTELLEELEKNREIKRIQTPSATYWELKISKNKK